MARLLEKYGPWALVTGATLGIGRAFTEQLAKEGFNIVAVARSEEELDGVVRHITAHYGIDAHAIVSDLSDADAADALFDATKDLDIGLVIPNAGQQITGAFTDVDLSDHEALIRLNILAPMAISRRFGNAMASKRRGGILLVSSLFAYQGIPYVANYAATKAYVLTLGEALNIELKRKGVDVTVLSPGLTKTPMTDTMPLDFRKLPMLSMTPERVAKIGLKALGRKATVVAGLSNKFYAWQNRLIPRSFPVRLFGALIRRAMHDKTLASPSRTDEAPNVGARE